jgi:hypothetical protein
MSFISSLQVAEAGTCHHGKENCDDGDIVRENAREICHMVTKIPSIDSKSESPSALCITSHPWKFCLRHSHELCVSVPSLAEWILRE